MTTKRRYLLMLEIQEFLEDPNATVRSVAQKVGLSKSTVHKDLSVRAASLHPFVYQLVLSKLALNKAERHIRGGMATKHRYQKEK